MTNSGQEPKHRIGLALSGGGARGFAHAGALKALEEANIRPEIIAGVSAGSVVAVLYASGLSPEKILEIFIDKKASDFMEISFSRGSILKIDKFARFIAGQIAPAKTFADLKIPAYVGATNLNDGLAEEFHEGDLLPAVQASCSIPMLFAPVKIGDTYYVDGGVLRNLPAWTIRDKCSMLIGINVSPLPKMTDGNPSLMEMALRTYQLMAKSNQNRDMEMCDLVVNLHEISQYNVLSLSEIEKVFNSGYFHMRKMLRDSGLWQKA